MNMPTNNMKSTDYYKSGQHKENILAAQIKAKESLSKNKQLRIDVYMQNPKLCGNCNCSCIIPYNKQTNKYCSKSCAAQVNNTNRIHSLESKQKKSQTMTGRKYSNRINTTKAYCKVSFKNCSVCQNLFTIKGGNHKWTKKTCSLKCKVIASVGIRSYQNGSRKPTWYYNQYQQKEVLLESSWEVQVAVLLDQKSIKWTRPGPITWYDSNGKSRLYFPDFYLPRYDLYLDPKNPYCMSIDADKLQYISKLICIKYGALDYILEIVNSLQM
jgi:hypothetical protein